MDTTKLFFPSCLYPPVQRTAQRCLATFFGAPPRNAAAAALAAGANCSNPRQMVPLMDRSLGEFLVSLPRRVRVGNLLFFFFFRSFQLSLPCAIGSATALAMPGHRRCERCRSYILFYFFTRIFSSCVARELTYVCGSAPCSPVRACLCV